MREVGYVENNKKLAIIGILIGVGIGIVLLCTMIVMIFSSVNSRKYLDLSDTNATEYLLIKDADGTETHVYKDYNSSSMFVTEGKSTKIIKTVRGPKDVKLGKLMSIRDGEESEGIEGNDITKEKEYAYNTWEAGIADSERYLKFLETQGYKCERSVYNSEYIEKWFTGERDVKRVIITQKTISVTQVPNTMEYPKVEYYIK